MIKSKVTFLINQPLERVFQYTTNPEHYSLWMPGLISISDLSHKQLINGSTFKLRHHESGKMEDLDTRVMTHETNARWSILATGKKLWFRRAMEFRARNGGTEVTYTEERTDLAGGLSFMFFLMNNKHQVLSEEGCENLKKLLENTAPVAATPAS